MLFSVVLLAGACGTRADYELLHLRELVRRGDREAVLEHHALLSPGLSAMPAVRELLLASELEAHGLDPLQLLAQLSAGLGDLRGLQAAVPADLLPEQDLARLVALAGTGIEGPPSPTALRLEAATLLLVGLSQHRGGDPAGLDLCLLALDGLASAKGDADLGLAALGSRAARILDLVGGLATSAPVGLAGADPGAAGVAEAGGVDRGAVAAGEAGGADPRRLALARYLWGAR
ncbi:MAG: hypothetical protein P1V81_08310 [Planctomycetota bacterium]|nr:hypothetical protein [Planctomycetota bacterium]